MQATFYENHNIFPANSSFLPPARLLNKESAPCSDREADTLLLAFTHSIIAAILGTTRHEESCMYMMEEFTSSKAPWIAAVGIRQTTTPYGIASHAKIGVHIGLPPLSWESFHHM